MKEIDDDKIESGLITNCEKMRNKLIPILDENDPIIGFITMVNMIVDSHVKSSGDKENFLEMVNEIYDQKKG